MNRYYRPSAPRYTSQFVEQQYPLDLIAQSGAMKYQNKQKMASDIAEFSAINSVIPAGYRTQEMAPYVREKWDNKINEVINKYSNSYDSPQALMEFTKLKQEWQRDPDVQLMKNDYEFGNKEWDEIRKSPTFALDKKGDNIDPKTGMLKQFKPGSYYQGYSPITRYAAWDTKAINEYKSIESKSKYVSQRIPFKDETGTGVREVQGEIQYKDPKMIEDKTISMAQNVINRSTPEGSYLYEDLKEKLGRAPTIEDAIQVYEPFARSAREYKENLNTQWKELTNTGGAGSGGADDTYLHSTQYTPVNENMFKDQNLRSYRQIKSKNWWGSVFGNRPEIDPNKYDEFKNTLARIAKETNNPGILKADKREQIKLVDDYLDIENNKKKTLKYQPLNETNRKEANDLFIGAGIDDYGLVKGMISPTLVYGRDVYDLDSGSEIQGTRDKDFMFEPDSKMSVVGVISGDAIARSNRPDGILVDWVSANGKDKKRLLFSGTEEQRKTNKKIWDLNSDLRAINGYGTGSVMQFGISNGKGSLNYKDLSDPDISSEDMLDGLGDSELFIRPITDYGTGRRTVKVYAANPSIVEEENEFGLTTGELNNTNKLFIKEFILGSTYKTKDQYGKESTITLNDMNDVERAIILDASNLFKTKTDKIKQLRNM